jgi:dethiobiotin synthetase
LRGCFVTGTGTGVGKTMLAAAIVAALRARGESVAALKPVLTGLDEPARAGWPHDHELLARIAQCAPEEVALATYGPAVSPHLAAELSGLPIDPRELRDAIESAAARADALVVEGVGGLLVPLTDDYDVRDLAFDTGLPLVVAAPPGLGTINHTLLTLEAARARRIEVAGVVLTPWPEAPSAVEISNRMTIERIGEVVVSTLPYVGEATPELLTAAGRLLPIDAWLE